MGRPCQRRPNWAWAHSAIPSSCPVCFTRWCALAANDNFKELRLISVLIKLLKANPRESTETETQCIPEVTSGPSQPPFVWCRTKPGAFFTVFVHQIPQAKMGIEIGLGREKNGRKWGMGERGKDGVCNHDAPIGLRFLLSPHPAPLPLLHSPAPTKLTQSSSNYNMNPLGLFPDEKPWCGQNTASSVYFTMPYICDLNDV